MVQKSFPKIRVGIIFGGKSAEHEVSLQSAKNVLEALDKTKFDPILIGIDKNGDWHLQATPLLENGGKSQALAVDVTLGSLSLAPNNKTLALDTNGVPATLDVVIPMVHGPFGEDGTLQGFLELAGIPYVGPGVLGSAIGMDKDVMKRLLRDAGIPTAPFLAFTFAQKGTINAQDVFKRLGETVFVKPANMGSSIGVARAKSAAELAAAIDDAFTYDSKIVIEGAIEGDEIECAVLGNSQARASVIGRIVPRQGDFYSYEAKYLDENGAVLEIPAELPDSVARHARDIAIKTFQVLECEGMGRVDMFLTKAGRVLVNEINTIPGFTKISMYPKLWEASGLSYTGLITELIELALERHQRKGALKTFRGPAE